MFLEIQTGMWSITWKKTKQPMMDIDIWMLLEGKELKDSLPVLFNYA